MKNQYCDPESKKIANRHRNLANLARKTCVKGWVMEGLRYGHAPLREILLKFVYNFF